MQDSELLDEYEAESKEPLNYKRTKLLGNVIRIVAFSLILFSMLFSMNLIIDFHSPLWNILIILFNIYSIFIILLLFKISKIYRQIKNVEIKNIEDELKKGYKLRIITACITISGPVILAVLEYHHII